MLLKYSDYTNKSEPISECNKLSKLLNGGLLVTLKIDKDAKIDEIKKSIEKTSELTFLSNLLEILQYVVNVVLKMNPLKTSVQSVSHLMLSEIRK